MNDNTQIISTQNEDAAAFTLSPIKDQEFFGVGVILFNNYCYE